MPDNQIARPVPPECWQQVYEGGPRPEHARSVLLTIRSDKGETYTTDGYWDVCHKEWKDDVNCVKSRNVLAYLDPGPYQEAEKPRPTYAETLKKMAELGGGAWDRAKMDDEEDAASAVQRRTQQIIDVAMRIYTTNMMPMTSLIAIAGEIVSLCESEANEISRQKTKEQGR